MPLSTRRGRALLGWVASSDGEPLYRVANVVDPATPEAFQQACQIARQARPAGVPLAAPVAGPVDLVGPVGLLAQNLVDTALYKRVYLPMSPAGIKAVPLISLVSPQWWVDDGYVTELVQGLPAHGDDAGLFEFCFQRGSVELPIVQGPLPNRGYLVAFSSTRRNLDVLSAAPTVSQPANGNIEVKFRVEPRPNHVMVAPIQGTDRLLILNGVHRLLALLRAGRDRAFCVLLPPVNANQPVAGADFANNPELFGWPEILAPQPPFLRHFLDGGFNSWVEVRELIQSMRIALVPDLSFYPRP